MKAPIAPLDGFAIQNTAHVLLAIKAYEHTAKRTDRAQAVRASIGCYESLSQRRVCARTIRRWLATVESYGGIAKTPENAFGARKSCPHFKRPIRNKLRQIEAEVATLSRSIGKQQASDPRLEIEMASIDLSIRNCVSRIQNDPVRQHLLSVRRMTRRLANTPIHRLYKFMSAPEMEGHLTELLARLRAVAANRAQGPSNRHV